VADAAREAFSEGTRYSAYAAAGFLVVGLLASLRLTARPVDHAGEPVEQRKQPARQRRAS
jgi:hypothetical protein